MIRACTTVDTSAWLALRQALWPDATREEHLEEMQAFLAAPERYGQFLCLDGEGEPVGLVEVSLRHDYVNGTESSPVGFVEGLYVRPEHRRRRHGAALMAAAEAWARAKGCRELASDAELHNTVSHRLHRALGFDETERVVYFRKPLAEG